MVAYVWNAQDDGYSLNLNHWTDIKLNVYQYYKIEFIFQIGPHEAWHIPIL